MKWLCILNDTRVDQLLDIIKNGMKQNANPNAKTAHRGHKVSK
jgi:hypothetical protein